jgi:hypothetical protein
MTTWWNSLYARTTQEMLYLFILSHTTLIAVMPLPYLMAQVMRTRYLLTYVA